MSDVNKAVFLSYAREDIAGARHIAEALRAAGIEVWFDEDELRGGDSWDAKIRKQIKECALFLPVISANTQARPEGYFRLEWKLADRRTDLIGKSKAFLVPVCIDDTREAHADVPDSFCAVQWTRLPAGETSAAFCARVKILLDGEVRPRTPSSAPESVRSRASALPAKPRRPAIALFAVALVALGVVAAVWQPWRQRGSHSAATAAAPVQSPSVSEVARLRARLVPHAWKKDDFEPYSAALDRIIAANEQNADAWALRSIINSLLVIRNYEAGTRPLETGRVAAHRAVYLDPSSGLGELALGLHFSAMISRGGDPRAPWPPLERAFAKLPADALTRFAEVSTAYNAQDFERTIRAANNWLQAEPNANHPAYILAQTNLERRDWAEAVKWAEKGATADDISGARAYATVFDAHYYLRADLKAARGALERIPADVPAINRTLYARWLLAMAERQYDLALQELTRSTETIFFDRTYRGPKALLTGLTHRAAGRAEVAQGEFREAERVLREQLANDPQGEEWHAGLALTLACLGRPDDARRELAFVEPAMRGRARNVYTGYLMVVLAQTHAMLGQTEPLVFWLRQLLSGPINPPFTPASLRIDPRFQDTLRKPEVQALLAEFAHLDAPRAAAAPVALDQKSIAVLAFKNLSDERDNDIFSDGVSEELANVLGRIPKLRVAGSTSAFSLKGKNPTPREIREKLGVGYFVEGTVRKVGQQVRITANLINAADGFRVWSSGSLDREHKDILGLQAEIAGLIAKHLSLTLGVGRPAKEVNPEAHRLVLEGRHFWNQRSERTEEVLAKAERAFAQALALDPEFAEAHAGLGDVHVTRGLYRSMDGRPMSVPQDYAQAKASARRALELNAELAAPYVTLAYVSYCERRFAESERYFAQAFAVNPNYALGHHWHSLLLQASGHFDESRRAIELAVRLDPLSSNALWTSVVTNQHIRRFDQALAAADRALALRPRMIPMHAARAVLLQFMGRTAEAIEAARVVTTDLAMEPRWWADADAIEALHKGGQTAEALQHAERVLANVPADDYRRAWILAALGRGPEAMEAASQVPPIALGAIYFGPRWDPWRETPAFHAWLKKLGCTEEYQRARASLARILAAEKQNGSTPAGTTTPTKNGESK